VVPGTQMGLWEALGHQPTSGPTAVVEPHRHDSLWVPPTASQRLGYASSAICVQGGLLDISLAHLTPEPSRTWGPGKEPAGWLLAVDEALYTVLLLSHGSPADAKCWKAPWPAVWILGHWGQGWEGTAWHDTALMLETCGMLVKASSRRSKCVCRGGKGRGCWLPLVCGM